ncbi:MAG: glucosaminidase domain-containing protein [Bacteroides sp.]|nr:glucosaminidase domain-containing protein [Bacteroides sp.]MDD2644584.1 glucosaminidase domain-containing protein [Bacteroides sp.]MDD4055706.1 glucosaminidase domain-containing protein [Bacteroides sp.]MDD4720711.1 glucosaminidase domain-containing protein [Bacteroides sp.]
MANNKYKIGLGVFLLFFSLALSAQRKNPRYIQYIEDYKDLAIREMQKHKIPASIKLAQGLLESGAGQSQLARRSNNHFGIKCGSNWRGKTTRHTDDHYMECFRSYSHPRESYEDHSQFLKKSRYASLFLLKPTDYKGWARGLKKAGYATDPSYANRLITIIEDYELYKYDVQKGYNRGASIAVPTYSHQVFLSNDLAYIIARDGDTFKSLGKEFDIRWKRLVKYNDLHKEYTITAGDIIYLGKKKAKANKKYPYYVVRDGDSMHSISQKFGVRMKNLYKMNRKDEEYVPEVGHSLRLR